MAIYHINNKSSKNHVYFDLKGYGHPDSINAIIRINKFKSPVHIVVGLSKEYTIKLRKRKVSIIAKRREPFFYGTEKELRQNYRHEIYSPSAEYKDKKFNNNQIYYKIPLSSLNFDSNKIWTIEEIFKDIVHLIKEQPEKLEKRVIKEMKEITLNLYNFPQDFCNEVNKRGCFYFFNI